MLKNIKWIALGTALLAAPALVAEEKLPDASVSVTAEFVSTYMFRGQDIHATNYYAQRGARDEGKTQAWTFQPDITFNTPVEGLTFGIWGSFAMNNRKDTDTDYRIQQGPGGTNLVNYSTGDTSALQTKLATLGTQSGYIAALKGTGDPSLQDPACRTSSPTCVPGMYKEENGLFRNDEIDYTIAYERQTKVGTLKGGIYYYTYPNVSAKSDADEEVFIGYALPQLPELMLTFYTYVDAGAKTQNYIELAYEDSFEINEDLSITYGATAGYGIQDRLQGIQNVDGSLGVEFRGFFIAANVSYRPDLRFFDTDSGSTDQLPMYLVGGSTRADGLVTDQSKTVGIYNEGVNAAIQSAIDVPLGSGVYTYTPRQKLPTEVYWINMGYSFDI